MPPLYFQYDLPPKVEADGRRPRRLKWSRGYPTKAAAQKALRAELTGRDQGVRLAEGKATVAGFAERFLEHLATVAQRDPRTVAGYRSCCASMSCPSWAACRCATSNPPTSRAVRPAAP